MQGIEQQDMPGIHTGLEERPETFSVDFLVKINGEGVAFVQGLEQKDMACIH